MVEIEIKSLTSSSHSLMDFTQINWINILDSDAGYPIIKFDILSINFELFDNIRTHFNRFLCDDWFVFQEFRSKI